MEETGNYLGKLASAQIMGNGIKASPFARLEDAVTALREVQKQAGHLASMLAGSIPENGHAGGLKEIAGGGLIDGIERQIGFINEITGSIAASLRRIEDRL